MYRCVLIVNFRCKICQCDVSYVCSEVFVCVLGLWDEEFICVFSVAGDRQGGGGSGGYDS